MKKMIEAKSKVDNYEIGAERKFNIFKSIPYDNNKKEISFDFQFRFIRDFFPYNDRYENKKSYDRQFLEILNKIFRVIIIPFIIFGQIVAPNITKYFTTFP